MNEQVREYLKKYPTEIAGLFCELRRLVYESASSELRETLWARMPSYESGKAFVRLPFKDHINIEARAVLGHRDALAGYKITPKGMLQIGLGQELPADVLRHIFAETLT